MSSSGPRLRITIAFILVWIQLSTPIEVHASTSSRGQDRLPFFPIEQQREFEQALKQADFADRLMVDWMLQLMRSVPLNRIETLVFGNPSAQWWSNRQSLMYGTFYEGEVKQVIEPAVQMFLLLFVLGLCASILISTMRIGINPHNPLVKTDFAEHMKAWILAGIFYASYPTILDFLFGMNESIRNYFYQLIGRSFQLSYLGEIEIQPNQLFGTVVISFIEFLIVLYLNFVYLSRKYVLMLLIIVGPIVGICLMFVRFRSVCGKWFIELTGNIFVQSVHAILLFTMVKSVGFSSAQTFTKIGMLLLLIPVSGLLTQWMGIGWQGSRIGSVLNISGFGSLGGMAALTQTGYARVKTTTEQRWKDDEDMNSASSLVPWRTIISVKGGSKANVVHKGTYEQRGESCMEPMLSFQDGTHFASFNPSARSTESSHLFTDSLGIPAFLNELSSVALKGSPLPAENRRPFRNAKEPPYRLL